VKRRIAPPHRLKLIPTAGDVRRLLAKVEPRQLPRVRGECWEWTANADDSGYGKFKIGGRQHWAHRVSYAFFRGTIPDGLQVDHRCHNPKCINPWHLRRRTQAANIAESNRYRARARSAEPAPF
jgi:hypothetical protein